MDIYIDYKNIETDNLIMGLYMGTNLQNVYDVYGKYDLKVDKESDKLFKYINGSSKLDKGMLNKLFKEFMIKGEEMTLFSFIFNWEEISYGKSLEEFLYYLENADENRLLKRIYSKLIGLQKDSKYFEKEKIQINNILEILINTEVDAEFKWYLIEVCCNVKGFSYKCSQFLRESKKILEKKLGPFNERGIIWGEKLKERIEKEGLAYVKKVLEDFNEEEYESFFISPRIMDSYAFNSFTGVNPRGIHMCFGEKYEELNEIFGKENERQWVQNVLRYLSDGSRFKIMELLKEEPMYAGELAESLGISNATISHHTTLLFLVKLLEETKINNRYYMRLRNDSIDKFLEVFSKEFNLEEGEKP